MSVSAHDLRPVTEFESAWATWPRGDRPAALRAAAEAFRARFAGTVRGVRTADLVSAPYPTRYAFSGAARAVNPFVTLVNRLVVVAYTDFAGNPRTLVWEPTLPAGSRHAPFYAHLATRFPARLEPLLAPQHATVPAALAALGLSTADVDVVLFDHLHVQDLALLLGTRTSEPLFPNAAFLCQGRELDTLRSVHPMQWAWYVGVDLDDVRLDSVVTLDGDVELGEGVALVRTPGHTDGNQTLVLRTDTGVWVSSENGVAVDSWHPEHSRIPGLAAYARSMGREVVLNANTLEDSIDQYDSMVLEKALADPLRGTPYRQILPSSELAPLKRQWPVVPTRLVGGVTSGTVARPAGLRVT
jgi:glyoxylase-like metal-dependent hydrolase (beta-lactamase superfamily II)